MGFSQRLLPKHTSTVQTPLLDYDGEPNETRFARAKKSPSRRKGDHNSTRLVSAARRADEGVERAGSTEVARSCLARGLRSRCRLGSSPILACRKSTGCPRVTIERSGEAGQDRDLFCRRATGIRLNRALQLFAAHWEDESGQHFKQGPENVPVEDAIAWGRARAPVVLVNVGDKSTPFSAGDADLPNESLPRWPKKGMVIRPRPFGTPTDGSQQTVRWLVRSLVSVPSVSDDVLRRLQDQIGQGPKVAEVTIRRVFERPPSTALGSIPTWVGTGNDGSISEATFLLVTYRFQAADMKYCRFPG
jgi:hypothetical protein